MKKVFLLFALASLTGLAAHSQVRFGARGGLNLSNIRGADVEGSKGQTGFHIGALAEIGLTGGFSLQPELAFSSEGAKSDNGEGIQSRLNLDYVNIPVLFKYTLQPGIFAATGPQLGILASAKTKIEGETANVKDSFKSTSLSWTFGAGYLSPFNIGIDFRYNLGLSKVLKEGDVKAYSSVAQIGLFYVIGHTGK